MAPPRTRRTRIVCISDTHNCTVNLPPGDVLIHAGDLTNQGSYSELSKTVKWLEAADYEAKIVVAGNHDITLDADFYFHHGKTFHNKSEQNSAECLALLADSLSITYLCHDSATIRLTSPKGPRTTFTVFGSPYSPRHGLWAFYYDAPPSSDDHVKKETKGGEEEEEEEEGGEKKKKKGEDDEEEEEMELTALWELIPLETDIVITHTPPRTHRDAPGSEQPQGCEALRQALWRVRPKLAVCGHVHGGRGAERVVWDLRNQKMPYAEKSATEWTDPGAGNKKMSMVDLTGRKGTTLENDGSHPGRPGREEEEEDDDNNNNDDEDDDDNDRYNHNSSSSRYGSGHGEPGGIIGYGLGPGLDGGDVEALRGRMGRRETCVVNAAIMAKEYPHTGGKEFNKPIVVDVDLPIWGDEDAEDEDEVDDEDDEEV